MIPRRFMRIWLDEEVPEVFESYWDKLKELHPRWEFQTFDDSSKLEWMRCKAQFDQAQTHAGRSDILRYEALARFGGIYLDTDVEPLKKFDALLGEKPFIGWEDENLLCPTVMGSSPGHPAITGLLHALPTYFAKYRGSPPNRQTGPYFVTRHWRGRSDVTLLPPEAFYPIHWSAKKDLGGPYPAESFAVHHWAAGWLPDGPPQRAG